MPTLNFQISDDFQIALTKRAKATGESIDRIVTTAIKQRSNKPGYGSISLEHCSRTSSVWLERPHVRACRSELGHGLQHPYIWVTGLLHPGS